ncbi:MAG TPA: hypothetical protein VFJ24_00295 [Gaiellales bacterium]|nr:hypothetical protein [Gaiellales bacterium]
MRAGRGYALGVTVVAAAALALSLIVPPEARGAVRIATGLALVVQGPLGWWLVRALGTERLLWIWAAGIAVRFALVAASGLLVAPKLGVALAPLLIALAAVLMGCVAVEAVIVRAQSIRETEVR